MIFFFRLLWRVGHSNIQFGEIKLTTGVEGLMRTKWCGNFIVVMYEWDKVLIQLINFHSHRKKKERMRNNQIALATLIVLTDRVTNENKHYFQQFVTFWHANEAADGHETRAFCGWAFSYLPKFIRQFIDCYMLCMDVDVREPKGVENEIECDQTQWWWSSRWTLTYNRFSTICQTRMYKSHPHENLKFNNMVLWCDWWCFGTISRSFSYHFFTRS